MVRGINEEIVHVNGVPKKLIVFLHGYIDTADYLNKKIAAMVENMNNVAIHLPQAPVTCEVIEDKRQWYSMHRFDPNDDRKIVPTMEECVAIYDKMASGLDEANCYLSDYLDQCLNEYQLSDSDLYLCGFSQGAMVALYASLMREQKIGGCVCFGGILAAHSYLEKHCRNTPDILLLHGNIDNLVRPEALPFTKKHLEQIGCKVKTSVLKDTSHCITEEGVKKACEFINRSVSAAGSPTKKLAI